jgi:hypothetical protein
MVGRDVHHSSYVLYARYFMTLQTPCYANLIYICSSKRQYTDYIDYNNSTETLTAATSISEVDIVLTLPAAEVPTIPQHGLL